MNIGRPVIDKRSANPYRLRALLRTYNVSQSTIAKALDISSTTLSHIICRREWPRQPSKDRIEQVVAEVLAGHGAPAAAIETAWDVGDIADTQAGPSNPADIRSAGKPSADEDDFQLPENEMLSPTARQHFGLAAHPFIDDVQGPADVFLGKEHRYARDSMYYAAKHGGFVAVVGESGSGKSTLRRDLVDRIARGNEPIVLLQPQTIDKSILTASHICEAIIADLSGESPRQSLEHKSRQLRRILSDSARAGNSHALVIEEAHDLGVATLKYLKRFWELEDGFKKLLGIILIGQPELGARLDVRRNYDAREVINRCEIATLKPLNGNLEEYLALKFKRIGVKLDELFEPDAFDAIRERLTRRRPNNQDSESLLYPLLTHNLICKAMNLAPEIGLRRISAELVRRV